MTPPMKQETTHSQAPLLDLPSLCLCFSMARLWSYRGRACNKVISTDLNSGHSVCVQHNSASVTSGGPIYAIWHIISWIIFIPSKHQHFCSQNYFWEELLMPLYATQYIHSYAVNSHGFCRAFLFHSLFRCSSYPCGAYSGPWRLYLLINLQSEQNCKNLPQFFCRYFSCCTLLFVVHHILVEPPTPCRLSSQHSTSTYFVNLYRILWIYIEYCKSILNIVNLYRIL